MKKISVLLFLLVLVNPVFSIDVSKLKFGDLFFSDPHSGQAKAVKIATRSEFSHCGFIFSEKGKWYILEAVQPVRIISFKEFLNENKSGPLKIKRHPGADALSQSFFTKLKFKAFKNLVLDLDYDPYFEWSDKTWYCSELVWKLYQRIFGIELCSLSPLKNYYLDDPIVKEIMYERYGDQVPYDELMVSPGDIYNSKLLAEVPF